MTPFSDTPDRALAVLGANGGIGKQAVLAALAESYQVTAILRTPANLTIEHPNLTIVQGDIMRPDELVRHLADKAAVISAIGKNSFKKTALYSQGSSNLLQAMEKASVNRAFFISASGLEVNPTHSLVVRLATRFILQPLLRNMYADLRIMERIVKESSINWTIMRPPQLTNGAATGTYRKATDHPLDNGLKISRADVAHFMVKNLVDPALFKKTVEMAY